MAELGTSLNLGASLQQRQAQEQVLSLQTQQRLKLLPLPVQSLQMELRQRAEQNPFLEFEPALETESLDAMRERSAGDEAEAEDPAYLLSGREGFGEQADFVDRVEAARRHEWRLLSQTEPETLYRHLERQVLESLDPGPQRELTLLVCDALDGDGYLRTTSDELLADWWQVCQGRAEVAEQADLPRAIATVQALDPVGVGARSLAECLALQVQAAPGYDTQRALKLRLCHHLNALLNTTPERLAKDLRCTLAELADALAFLKHLNPFPGRAFTPKENLEVPEVVALPMADGTWKATCDERVFPRFRVDEAAIEAAREAAKTREERACVSDLENAARLLVDAYHERNDTLRRVAQVVFNHQRAFLASGGEAGTLKPLLQRDVAQEVGYDESIISRTIKDKAVRVATARKPIPLKAFFTRALPAAAAEGAESVSEQQAKQLLRELVAAEDPAAPLSDQAIMEAMAARGVPLARRTVAKYRDALGIPSTRERRKR